VIQAPGRVVALHSATRQSELLTEPTDDDLMLLARGGSTPAFDRLVRRYQERALRLATRNLNDTALAREAAQRAFIELYHFLPRYQPKGKFAPFFFRVLVNQCRMLRRSQKSEARLHEAAQGLPLAPPPLSDERLLARERRVVVERALAELSEKLRDVVVLRYAGEMPYEEIAATLELPVGTVKSRLAAGMVRLRELLGEEAP
jgi:RNA polymerase sigma-70 factor, ECF subfamily